MQDNDIEFDYRSGLSDEEMVQAYVQADIIAFASTYEGFGMPILEGQATGRPVITSNISSMPEVAGNAACLVDPFDVTAIRAAFDKVITDDAYREKLIMDGLENVKRFSPQLIADKYLQLYKQMV
ncbi:MAG TPA: glycosyltransferase, partial [Chitinophagaceae bacterium]|nr:glycosyltransferase [Chitinophagaceae bacterium]